LADIHYQLEVPSCSNSVVIDSCPGLLVTRLNSRFLWEVQCHCWIRVTVSGGNGYINDYSTGSFLRDANYMRLEQEQVKFEDSYLEGPSIRCLKSDCTFIPLTMKFYY